MTFLEFYNIVLGQNKTDRDLSFPVEKVFFQKGHVITAYEEVEHSVYFINKGIIELSIKSYMTEKVIDFFFDNEMVASLTSFLQQTHSDVKLTALTNCELEMVKYEHLDKAYEHDLDINQFGRKIMEGAYIRKSNREKALLTKTAEEIYAEMFKTHPNYISQIPVNKIAKYLGIHPESLSRIRKKLNS
ncbi:Crp/Fnr family transcriptional regulator [Croceitalea rosinachiae]|uniref:Crp/Fnr family transcriptional regulator n=1 Tax=Croceitalea rosinachiae TaxID=3075596 RepID=A0ABU3A8U6_9FLAO|nr:Crp/Fnr family transcriptional regulator [Croceitalea sp. F388]MDT0606230.1 Crp/Fnr family transcriptional regulator [Croceitalea sp. F388]